MCQNRYCDLDKLQYYTCTHEHTSIHAPSCALHATTCWTNCKSLFINYTSHVQLHGHYCLRPGETIKVRRNFYWLVCFHPSCNFVTVGDLDFEDVKFVFLFFFLPLYLTYNWKLHSSQKLRSAIIRGGVGDKYDKIFAFTVIIRPQSTSNHSKESSTLVLEW